MATKSKNKHTLEKITVLTTSTGAERPLKKKNNVGAERRRAGDQIHVYIYMYIFMRFMYHIVKIIRSIYGL